MPPAPTRGPLANPIAPSHFRYVHTHDPEAESLARMLADSLDIHPITARVLVRRGIKTKAAAEHYLQPRLAHLLDPSDMADFRQAVLRIADAVVQRQPIGVFGDYDVDDITAAAVIMETLMGLGLTPEVRVASRDHGYGLTVMDMEAFHEKGCRLVVACDVGSGDHSALDAAPRLSVDVVVLDHHHIAGDPPKAYALVNPGRPGCPFPFHDMASVGVAFYVAAALRTELDSRGWFERNPEPDIKALLDLVAIGTIADVVPLGGINRVLVHAGLVTVNQLRRPGLRFLARLAGLQDPPPPIGVKDVAFRLAPRINAAGRIGDAMPALRLLLERDTNAAWHCALELDGRNRQRQRLQEDVFQAALSMVEAGGTGEHITVVAGEGWHPGVVGIVASKLADLYGRPAVVISLADGDGRGSVRTFAGIDVFRCLEAGREHLIAFGGHASAAGLTIKSEEVTGLREKVNQAVLEQRAASGGPSGEIQVDARVALEEIDDPLVTELERIQPTGEGNREPRLLAETVVVLEVRLVGTSHLRLRVADATGGPPHEVIGFGMAHLAPVVGQRLSMVFTPEHNTYRGRTTVQLRLHHLAQTEEGGDA